MVGDLLVIDHAERMTPDEIREPPNPLISDGLLIKPTLTPKIVKHERPDIAFALPLALSPNESAPPAKLALLSKSGEALAAVALSLGMADGDGRVLAIGHVPLDKVPPGSYVLQVTVGSGVDPQVGARRSQWSNEVRYVETPRHYFRCRRAHGARRRASRVVAPGTVAASEFGTSTAAVLVDVVVRDKKGKPVSGLTAEDFQVFEDGVPQKVISCDASGLLAPMAEPVPPARHAEAGQSGQPGEIPRPVEPGEGQTVVALVFDWLTEQSRAEAYKAARTLVDDMKPGDYAGVFSVDHSLHRLVPFTRDTTALSAGFELALTRPRPSTARVQGAQASALLSRPETSPTAGAEDPNAPAAANPANPVDSTQPPASATAASDQLFAAELQSIDDFDRYASKEIQATAVSDSLRGLVQLLAPLPGRKTVVLFSEGLQVTNSTVERWGHLTDEANRQNVSFYTFDAQGLRVQSDQAAMGRMLGPKFREGLLPRALRRQHGAAQRGAARRDDAWARGARVEHRRPSTSQHEQSHGRLRARQRGPALVLHALVLVDEPDARRQIPLDHGQGAAPGIARARAPWVPRVADDRARRHPRVPRRPRPRCSRNVRRRGRSRSSFRRSRRRCRAGPAWSAGGVGAVRRVVVHRGLHDVSFQGAGHGPGAADVARREQYVPPPPLLRLVVLFLPRVTALGGSFRDGPDHHGGLPPEQMY